MAFGFLSIIPVALTCGLICTLVAQFRKWRISTNPISIRIKHYENAIEAYSKTQEATENERLEAQRRNKLARFQAERARQAAEKAERRKRREHWETLRGIRFEQELATLYRHLGYQVQSTPKSGDQDIDLILTKDGKITIVQCKGQKDPANPAVVRELYGSFAAFQGAHYAILAATTVSPRESRVSLWANL